MSALLDRITKNGAESEFISDDDLCAVIAYAENLETLGLSDKAADAAATSYYRQTFGEEPTAGWLEASRVAFKGAIQCAIETVTAE